MKSRLHRRRVLAKCGFEQRGSGRGPEEKWILEVEGKGLVKTSLPRGNKEIKPGTFSSICNQMCVDKIEYREIESCNLGREEYLQLLVQRI